MTDGAVSGVSFGIRHTFNAVLLLSLSVAPGLHSQAEITEVTVREDNCNEWLEFHHSLEMFLVKRRRVIHDDFSDESSDPVKLCLLSCSQERVGRVEQENSCQSFSSPEDNVIRGREWMLEAAVVPDCLRKNRHQVVDCRFDSRFFLGEFCP